MKPSDKLLLEGGDWKYILSSLANFNIPGVSISLLLLPAAPNRKINLPGIPTLLYEVIFIIPAFPESGT